MTWNRTNHDQRPTARRTLIDRVGLCAMMALAGLLPSPSYAIAQTPFQIAPPADHTPVVLVPGWSDGAEELAPLQDRFLAAGWPSHAVHSVEFEDPEGSNVVHAEELATSVRSLLDRTGASRVDIVAHSMGGLAVRQYLQDDGASSVRKVVFLATPHRGTVSANVAWGDGAREMEPGSVFLQDLMRAPLLPGGVIAITIRTPLDLHIVPGDNATLPGVPDVEVCCPTHAGLLDDDDTFRAIQRFLLPD